MKSIIAILIPVHNGFEYTRKCLDNLQQILPDESGPFVFRNIVIDDGSTDSTAQWIRENHPDAVVLSGDGNLWWSGAINLGAKYAIDNLGADYVLLWNNDIEIKTDYFSRLTEIISHSDKNTIIGSKIYCDSLFTRVWSAGGIFNPFTGDWHMIGSLQDDQPDWQKVMEVDWLTGMGTLVPKDVISKTGYWDSENFPQYYGDTDFTLRAKIHGYKIKVYPQLKIINDTSNSGIKVINNWSEMKTALTSIKSINNISINYKFFRRHSKTFRAFFRFFTSYFCVFGGVIKRKIKRTIGPGR